MAENEDTTSDGTAAGGAGAEGAAGAKGTEGEAAAEDKSTEGKAAAEDKSADEAEKSSSRFLTKKTMITIGVAGATALVATIGSGLGDRALSVFDSDPPPPPEPELVSSSDFEQRNDCGTRLFATAPTDQEVLSQNDPSAFQDLLDEPDLVTAERSSVTVSIQGETERPVTLTGIDFDVNRKPLPDGSSFGLPCGGPGTGRQMLVDLDRDPPAIIDSVDDPNGSLEAVKPNGKPLFPPIEFPWSVSLTDPLLLTIIAKANECYCEWSAHMPWVSGGKRGVLTIDNEGNRYVTVGQQDVTTYSAGNDGWTQFELE